MPAQAKRGPYAAVVGGANMDIGGRPAAPAVPRDSNPGTVRFSPGGVGRNIAHNLALLGREVAFISVFGDDPSGEALRQSCLRAGIGIENAPVLPGGRSAAYLFILNHEGDMELAVSDMGIYEEMGPAFLAPRMDAVNRAGLCVADTNLPAEGLAYLARHCDTPLYIDPVSTTKAKKLAGLLGHVHTLKCNRAEAALLAGVDAGGESGPERAAAALLAAGLRQVVITLGAEGCLCAGDSGLTRLPACPAAMANATGAGDAFTAALAHGRLAGLPLESAARLGLAAASLAVASADTISPDISDARVRAIAGMDATIIDN